MQDGLTGKEEVSKKKHTLPTEENRHQEEEDSLLKIREKVEKSFFRRAAGKGIAKGRASRRK